MRFEITPRKGINSLRFGDDREEVRKALSTTLGPYSMGLRGADAYDCYSVAGLFAYYDSADKLEALEAARPSEVQFSGADILSMDLGAAIAFLSEIGEEVTPEEDGAVIPPKVRGCISIIFSPR